MSQPPFTSRFCPVMNRARSERRKCTATYALIRPAREIAPLRTVPIAQCAGLREDQVPEREGLNA